MGEFLQYVRLTYHERVMQLDRAANSILCLSLIYAPLSCCRRCGANRNIGQQEERFQSIQLLPSGSTLPMEVLFVLDRHLSSPSSYV